MSEVATALRRLSQREDDLRARFLRASVAQRLFGTGAGVDVAGARFEVKGRLGAGAMGAVYEVARPGVGDRVALKLLHRPGLDEVYRLKREFRMLSRLGHPNLVVLHELFADGQGAAFTMELVRGMDFLAYVRAEPARARERLESLLAQLAEGLGFLHAEGVIHRDLKPSNVLVTPEGRAVLLDFGAALAGPERDVSGTARFMAPEQRRGETVPASDLYALGVMVELALADVSLGAGPPGELGRLRRIAAALTREEVAARPSPLELVSELSAQPRVRLATRRGSPFVGRTRELAELEALASEAREAPRVVYVEGHAGDGKSALLAELGRRLSSAASAAALVLAGRCCRRETVRYRALDPLLDALSELLAEDPLLSAAARSAGIDAHLLALFPTLARARSLRTAAPLGAVLADPRERRAAAVRGLRRLLASLCEVRALVMCVDDVHWLDDESLELVRALLDGPDAPPLLWVFAGRPQQESGFHALLRAVPAARLRVLALAPLEAEDARALARAMWPDGERMWERATGLSGGSPFLLSQLGQLVLEGDDPGALTLDEVVARRLERLPLLGRTLLDLVALAAEPLATETLCRAADVTRAELDGVLHALEAQRYVRPSTSAHGLVEPYHDRIAECVTARLDQGARAQLHRRIADALAADDAHAHAHSLLHHYRGAGDFARALHHGRRAAERACAQLSFHEAAELFGRCRALARDAAEREALDRARADALTSAGRDREAAEILSALAAHAAGSDERYALAVRAAELFFQAGYSERAMELLAPFLTRLGLARARTRPGRLASLLYHRVRLLVPSGRGAADEPHAARRLELCALVARGLGRSQMIEGLDYASRLALHARHREAPRELRARALLLEGILRVTFSPASPRGDALLAEAAALCKERDDPLLRARWSVALAQCAGVRGDRARMGVHAREAVRLFEGHGRGVQMELAEARWLALLSRFGSGTVTVRELERLLADAQLRKDRMTEANARICLSTARIAAGDVAGARADSEAVRTLGGPRKALPSEMIIDASLARADLYEGNPARARARLAGALRALRLRGFTVLPWLRIELRYLHALATLAEGGPRAPREVRRAAERLRREGFTWPRLLGRQLDAALRARDGAPREAARQLRALAALLESEGGAWYAWGCSVLACELEGDSGGQAALEAKLRERGSPEPRRFLSAYAPFLRPSRPARSDG